MNRRYYVLARPDVGALFAATQGDYDVVAKARDAAGNVVYGRPGGFGAVVFTDEQPRLSAKSVAYPQSETLISYKRDGKNYEDAAPAPSVRETLLFGCNLCDAAAFEIIDKVFTWDFQDDPYLARRARMTILALACIDLQKDCFCNRISFPEENVDVVAYPAAENFLLETRTAKGEAFAAKYGAVLKPAPPQAADQLAKEKTKWPTAKKGPDLAEARPGLEKAFEHADWKTLVSTCIGCGTCTYLCPTCHCFDVQDEGSVYAGVRLRTWDHCTGKTFTLMPGHQPRDRQYKRYRQRLLHKFWYYPERFRYLLCTGCGRCTTYCPVNINIKELVEYFGGLKTTPPGGARRK